MKLQLNTFNKFVLLCFLLSSELAFGLSTSVTGSLNLGQVKIGQSVTTTLTVKNTSASQIRLDSSWFTGSSDFKLATGGTCALNGWVLKGGKSCTVKIKFAPTTASSLSTKYTLGYFLGTGWKWEEIPATLTGQGIKDIVATP